MSFKKTKKWQIFKQSLDYSKVNNNFFTYHPILAIMYDPHIIDNLKFIYK